ncbi:UDP-N-acetylglucosamine 2-epimerase (non-hydrolyzing) [Calidifontimicrobium sp. SYSU G02091]|uniref:non-hydrolyzing UDP-N-acetylglucosamine 2-epimerase n=1 Tax=Calidifontimicrobium sp. SYSU G02091 TaxID=2926421 RepID=UPI001F5322F2|nr:UDP-N-acetylglucosamine 2-epimerase (non-hydrolyzing) [Calidifontimicrobium sp. SYSU G02091]MCI1193654.1 UDP-N-acetylglucosamine 2-epimerase (non-hydrolyzing) [Calidifontimicrobium sp. SYSU G02091]
MTLLSDIWCSTASVEASTKAKSAAALICVGTRPEIIKMAPVRDALRAAGQRVMVVHTGQHSEMAWPLFDFFDMRPDICLRLRRERDGLPHLAAELLDVLGTAIARLQPGYVLVHGDTLSAMAAAQAAFFARVPIAHVEAGLRSGRTDDPFPEEMCRQVIGRFADLHFAPTERAALNLRAEGVNSDRIVVTGNTVVDAALATRRRLRLPGAWRHPPPLEHLFADSSGRIVLVTAHRRENWGGGIAAIARAVVQIVRGHADVRAIWPLHANPRVAQTVENELRHAPDEVRARVLLLPPVDYPSLIDCLSRSWLVLTDSGGIQEEAASLGKPVFVLRETTERPEILDAGLGRLVGADENRIVAAFDALSADAEAYRRMCASLAFNPFGDGLAATRIAEILRTFSFAG